MAGRLGSFQALQEAQQLRAAGRLGEAAAVLAPVAEADPGNAAVQRGLGLTLFAAGQYEAGLAALSAAVELMPWSAEFTGELAVALNLVGRWSESVPFFRRALGGGRDPQLSYQLGMTLLGLGEFKEGWSLFEARKALPHWAPDRLNQPGEWAGEELAGRRVLIWPEQGWGDQIQFCRFAAGLAERGAEVTLVAAPPVQALFSELPVTVARRSLRPEPLDVDLWIHPLSIPHCLGVELPGLDGGPYLRAPGAARARWADYLPRRSIGFAWRGRPSHANDAHRSLPSPGALIEVLRDHGHVLDLSDPMGDFADLAAVIEQLDLVVTVDTATAHLAGALGKPCWILLPAYQQDWRWMQGRTDSPWYGSVRLFRQPRIGDWESVIQQVAQALGGG